MSAASSASLGRRRGRGRRRARAGLVEGAVGLGAAVVLGDAAAVPERGGPVVALLGVDLDHGPILRGGAQPTGLKAKPVITLGKK